MGLGSSIKCAVCDSSSYDQCDHCGRYFCTSHFRSDNCMNIRGNGSTTVRGKLKCISCSSDAVGTCDGCEQNVCSLCFSFYHREQCGRKYHR